jgi:hypothetical protein
MKLAYFVSLVITATAFTGSARAAAVVFTGDAGDTPVTLTQFGAAGPGPIVDTAGGNPGGRLQVTDAVNGLQNVASFDQTQTGTVPQTDFTFQFKIEAPVTASADGFHFAFIDTSVYGTTGMGANLGEDPGGFGVLGFGFDTWSNNGSIAAPPGDPNVPMTRIRRRARTTMR